jgi:hypothetical protein
LLTADADDFDFGCSAAHGERCHFKKTRMLLRLRYLLLVSLLPSVLSNSDLPDDLTVLPIGELHSLTTALISSSRYIPLLTVYDELYRREPNDWNISWKRATFRLALGRLEGAKEGFRDVIKLGGGNKQAEVSQT